MTRPQRLSIRLKRARTVAIRLMSGVSLVASLQAVADQTTPFAEVTATPEHLLQLQRGGFVLYMRHGATDARQPDRQPEVDLKDCSTQRPLNDTGRKSAVAIGHALRDARIPVDEILVSPYCRALETAKLAFDMKFKVVDALGTSANMTSLNKGPNLASLRQWLTAPVASGGNRVVIGHAPNLADLTGYFIAPEGTIAIFRPGKGDTPDYVASIPPASWRELNAALARPQAGGAPQVPPPR